MPKETRYIVPIKRKKEPKKQQENYNIILMSGSISYKMKSYGPKCLIDMQDGSSLLYHQIKTIKNNLPQSEVILVIGFGADKIIKKKYEGIRIVENQLFNDSGEIEQLRLALNNRTSNKVLILHGDLFFNDTFINDLELLDRSLMFCNQDKNFELGLIDYKEKITNICYSSENKWCEAVYLTGKELDLFEKFCNNRKSSKLYMFEGLNKIIDKSAKFYKKDMSGVVKV